MPTTPPSITALPTPPDPNDRATFNPRAYPWSAALIPWTDEANALADNVHHNATEAATAATALSGAAGTATAAAIAASADRVLAQTAAGTATSKAGETSADRVLAQAAATAASNSASQAAASAASASAIVLGVSTGHPTIRPSLLLDFANSRYVDPRITFTRSSTATRINERGLIETVAANVPRIDFDPVTGECKGWRIEEARTNLLLNSLIDGTNLTTQTVTVTAVAHTLTFYGTGQVVLSGAHSATLTGTGAFPNCAVLTFTPTAGTLTLTVTGVVKFAQLEAGTFPTSYIPTAASAVTRAADVAAMTGTNFSSWYRQEEGSFVVEADYIGITGYARVFEVNDATTNNIMTVLVGPSTGKRIYASVLANGADQGDTASSVNDATLNSPFNAAIAYKLNDTAFQFNTNAVTTDTSCTPPSVTQLRIGNGINGASIMSGHILRLAYYAKRLSNSELQALTA